MSDREPRDFLEGSAQARAGFAYLNLNFQLKMRPFIELCMPAAFAEMERFFSLFAMREHGIVPIMFLVEFEAGPMRLAFGRPINNDYRIGFLRHVGEGGRDGGRRERLVMVFSSTLTAHGSTGDSANLGFEPEKGPLLTAGKARVLQLMTRPMEPPGRRDVAELPGGLGGLREQPWEGPFPSRESLEEIAPGFREEEPDQWGERLSVWGLANTDINQHVNVEEYISAMEDQFTRQVFAAGLPVARHRSTAAKLLFRKPFFPGDAFATRGRLFVKGDTTVFLGGVHRLDSQGRAEEQPGVVARFEGTLDG